MALISRFRPRTLRWRVYSLVGVLLGLLIGTVFATLAAREHAADLGSRVRDQLRPAQVSIAALTKGYVDMETGLRGYVITRDEQFLDPYEKGGADVAEARRLISRHLADEPVSMRLLASVGDAGDFWMTTLADPLIEDTRTGSVTRAEQIDSTTAGEKLFERVRTGLLGLQDRIEDLIAAGLQSTSDAQNRATTITLVCAGVALGVGVLIILLLRMSLVRPVNRLVESVGRVSTGDLDPPLTVDGPTEVVAVGNAVESMRRRMLAESAAAAEQSEKLARLEEADRIGQDLERTVIHDLFAVSLAVQSVAGRHPAARVALAGVIRDLDRLLGELRSAVLGRMTPLRPRTIRTDVLDMLVLLEQDLAITPELRLTGDHDLTLPAPVATDVLDVLHDAVFATTGSGVAKQVAIAIALSSAEVRLSVAGSVPEQARAAAQKTLDELAERARRHGGEATVDDVEGRLAVDWRIPVEVEAS